MNTKKTVLILGSKGSLGGQLVAVFFGKEYEVIAWDRQEIDITDRELILKKVEDLKPDLIINAAAYNAVDKCENDDGEYELAKKINIDGPKFLAEAALKVDALLVHYSTDYVFDGMKKEGYRENDMPNPINRYGKTKFHGEKHIIELSGSGLKWYLIRTARLFGPKGESEVAKPSFFDTILKISEEEGRIKAIDEETGSFTYAPDLAEATKKLIESGKGYGIYHLINSDSATWYEAASELFRIKEVNTEIKPVKSGGLMRSAKRPACSILLNTKFEQLRSWREALREYIKINKNI